MEADIKDGNNDVMQTLTGLHNYVLYDLLISYSTLELNMVETEILTNTEENFSAKVNNAFTEGLQNFKLMMQNFIVMAAYNF